MQTILGLMALTILTVGAMSAQATTAPRALTAGQSIVLYSCDDNTGDSIDDLNATLEKPPITIGSSVITEPFLVSAPSLVQLNNCSGTCACAAVTLTKQ